MSNRQKKLTASHWGAGVAFVEGERITAVKGHPGDPAPSPINDNIPGSLHGRARVLRPAIRKSWLEGMPSEVPRGQDSFIEVSWDRALDLLAAELNRVREAHGNSGIYAGSYGWSSAGRFHHAQSQLKRFLNQFGGFVRSEGNYSYNAALELMPHIVGPFRSHVVQATRWSVIAKHTDLVVLFGGMALRNTQVSDGGVARHRAAGNLQACADAGVEFVNISPLRSDAQHELNAHWISAFSSTIAGFDLADCKGHATWFPPRDLADGKKDTYPLYLLSGQPGTRLHSQLDNGAYSLSHKIAGREPVLVHPDDARSRDIKDGDVVELYNERGRCLAGVRITDEIQQGSVFLWTGAWFDPDFAAPQARDRHGNPNVLTHDRRTSSLTQSPAAHSALIQIVKFDGEPPPVQAHEPPHFEIESSLQSGHKGSVNE